MKIIDRYIVRQFLINFVILTAVLMLLFVVVDLIVQLDEFLEAGRWRAARLVIPQGETFDPETDSLGFVAVAIGMVWTVFDFYGPMVVLLYVFFSGLLVTAAMGFTFTSLTRSRELVAVMSSGLSLYRIAAPVLVTGCLLNLMTLPIQEYLIPALAPKLARKHSQVRSDHVETFKVDLSPDRQGNLFRAAEFDPGKNMLRDVTIAERRGTPTVQRRIRAAQAFWVDDGSRRGWALRGGTAVDTASNTQEVDAQNIDFYETDLSPQVLLARRAAIYSRLLSFGELRSLMDSMANPSQIQQIIHSRFSLLVVNVLVLVMGLPFFLLRNPAESVLSQAVKASCVCIGAWATALTMQQIGVAQLNPLTAAWLPVLIYLPVMTYLLQSIKT